jgi:hypothetical protein
VEVGETRKVVVVMGMVAYSLVEVKAAKESELEMRLLREETAAADLATADDRLQLQHPATAGYYNRQQLDFWALYRCAGHVCQLQATS